MEICCGDEGSDLDAAAILHCLKFLAKEAASLNLMRTLLAIEKALEAAAWEGIPADRHGTLQPHTFMH